MRSANAFFLWKYLRLSTCSLLVLGVCLAFRTTAQTDYPEIYHQSYVNRHRLLDSVIEPAARKLGPAGYAKQMAFLRAQAVKRKDHELILAVDLYRQNYDLTHFQLTADERIARLNTLLQSIDRKEHPAYAAWFLYELGNNNFGGKHDYTRAFNYYAEVINLLRDLPSNSFPSKKDILVNIANKYYRLGAYDQSKKLLRDADTIAYSWEKGGAVDYNAKNTMGLIYRTNGDIDSAIFFFKIARQLAQQHRDSVWMAIASGNIGICYYMAGNYAAAVPLLYNDIKYSFTPGNQAMENGLKSLLILADIHLRTDSIQLLGKDIALAYLHIDSCLDKVKPYSMLYALQAKYLVRLGKYKEAALAYDSAAIYKDSLIRRDNIYQLARIEHYQEVEKHKAEVQQLNADRRLAVFTRNGLLTVLILLIIITALVISRQRVRQRIRDEMADQELRSATEKLEAYTLHLQEKNELIEQAGHEIQQLQATINDRAQFQSNNEVLQKLYSSTILTDEAWNEFKSLFEQVHKGYLQWLRDKIPDLTPSDTRFLVLNKLKLSNKEMAGILGIQPDSVRSYKHRLKKRLDLTGDAALKSLLDELLERSPGTDLLNERPLAG